MSKQSVLCLNAGSSSLKYTIPHSPGHQKTAIAGIEALRKINPECPQVGLSAGQTEHLLSQGAGLLGVSGTSDMRMLIEKMKADPRAHRAIEMFCYSIQKPLGGLVAVLGGLDLLIFKGGIGENNSMIREKIISQLKGYLNFETKVIKTDEEQIIAEQTYAVISQRREE